MEQLKGKKTRETETTCKFDIEILIVGGDHKGETFIHTKDVFKTPEAAKQDGNQRVKDWGSNLVYLGHSPVEINGVIYYENGFNVWD